MREEDTVLRRRAIARALRQMIGRIPQNAIAKSAGISPTTLSSYLTGDSLAGETKLQALAETLGKTALEIWTAINDCQLEILAETTAEETREPPPEPYDLSGPGTSLRGPGSDGLELPLRRFVRSVACETIAELKAQGLLSKR